MEHYGHLVVGATALDDLQCAIFLRRDREQIVPRATEVPQNELAGAIGTRVGSSVAIDAENAAHHLQ